MVVVRWKWLRGGLTALQGCFAGASLSHRRGYQLEVAVQAVIYNYTSIHNYLIPQNFNFSFRYAFAAAVSDFRFIFMLSFVLFSSFAPLGSLSVT